MLDLNKPFLSDLEIEQKIEALGLIDDSKFLFELIFNAQCEGHEHSDQYLINAYNEFYEIDE